MSPAHTGPSHSAEGEAEESAEDDESDDSRKRRRSDSYSLTFDDSLSWCVIGGLGSGRDRLSSQSSDSHSTVREALRRRGYGCSRQFSNQGSVSLQSGRSDVTIGASDSDSDNFSVEFEVESVDSDDYNEDDASLSADDQVNVSNFQMTGNQKLELSFLVPGESSHCFCFRFDAL